MYIVRPPDFLASPCRWTSKASWAREAKASFSSLAKTFATKKGVKVAIKATIKVTILGWNIVKVITWKLTWKLTWYVAHVIRGKAVRTHQALDISGIVFNQPEEWHHLEPNSRKNMKTKTWLKNAKNTWLGHSCLSSLSCCVSSRPHLPGIRSCPTASRSKPWSAAAFRRPVASEAGNPLPLPGAGKTPAKHTARPQWCSWPNIRYTWEWTMMIYNDL